MSGAVCALAALALLAVDAGATATPSHLTAHLGIPKRGGGAFYEITASAAGSAGKQLTAGDVAVTITNLSKLPANIRASYRVGRPTAKGADWSVDIIVAINYPTSLAVGSGAVAAGVPVGESDGAANVIATLFGFPGWAGGSEQVHRERCSVARSQAAGGGFRRTNNNGPTPGNTVARFAATNLCKKK
ncbi:MAG: hypothetical protein ACYDA6_04230 [Solirubrobacteraceae bacterium]